MNRDREADRRRADALRSIPLATVLTCRGAERDRHDRAQWHTERGTLSVSGTQFWNWTRQRGGGGAIDLVMHLADAGYRPACEWLEQHLGSALGAGLASSANISAPAARPVVPSVETTSTPASSGEARDTRRLMLPPRDDRRLPRVRDYLEHQRGLPAPLLEPLISAGKLFADARSNAVFVLVSGKTERPVGAELRGTGPRIWRGMARGTSKDLGYFWTGQRGSRQIVLCESAIDALSCAVLFPNRICLSTSGARSNPPWLSGLLSRGYKISCGFDADEPGDMLAAEMLSLYPHVHRLRPWAHDWNDVLTAAKPQSAITTR